MQPPKCLTPECNKPARKNHTGKTYLKYCSLECQWVHSSAKGAAKRKETNIKKWGFPTNLQSADTKAKIKQTCEERYGASHAMKAEAAKLKVQQTKEQKYGDPNYNNRNNFHSTMKSKSADEILQIQSNRKQTNLEKYGVEYVLQVDSVRQSGTQTCLERYGVDNAAKNTQVKQKIQQTMKDRYGCHFAQQHMATETIQCLSDPEWLANNSSRLLIDIAQELGVTYHTVSRAYEIQGVHKPDIGYNRSQGEKEIVDWLSGLGVTAEVNRRDLLNGQELDIWIPANKLAIEYNGLFWHCEQSKPDRLYHQKKHQLCAQHQINLIQITDWHWRNQSDLVKSRLSAKLGLSANKIGARQCVIKPISAAAAAEFLEKNHIQGTCAAPVHLALEYQNQVVSLLSMARSRFKADAQWELVRFAVQKNTNIPGAASKLWRHFVQQHQPQSVISYCDLSWNTGGLYAQLGFKWLRDNGPNYWYTYQYRTWENRMRYQKHKLASVLDHFDPNQTEWENMQANGWDRYWDCGSSVWLWTDASC